MTENLLQKLEEKMMVVLSEVEGLRQEIQTLRQENSVLHTENEKFSLERKTNEKKLQDILSLFDAVKQLEPTLIADAEAA